jgi:hypothetical protein
VLCCILFHGFELSVIDLWLVCLHVNKQQIQLLVLILQLFCLRCDSRHFVIRGLTKVITEVIVCDY